MATPEKAATDIRDSLAEFQTLCQLHSDKGAGAVIDGLNAMHDDDVRHIVLSLILKANGAIIAEGVE